MSLRVRVRIIGGGTMFDPWRVPLPTYQEISGDYVNLVSISEIPDEDAPPSPPDYPGPEWEVIGGVAVLVSLNPVAFAAWTDHLTTRYGGSGPITGLELV